MRKVRRIVIYPQDVQIITGKTLRQSQRLLREIHAALAKKPHQLISISEFSDYTGLPIEEVRSAMQ